MARLVSIGKCELCGSPFDKSVMTNHLKTCLSKHWPKAKAPAGRRAGTARLYHLVVDGLDLPMYWMHLQVPGKAVLSDLDLFLRDTWLECCGHLSEFLIGGTSYVVRAGDWSDEELTLALDTTSMDVRLDEILTPGLVFFHEYDFGSTTRLRLRVVSATEGTGRGRAVRVLARNVAPEIPCSTCGAPAVNVCTECLCSEKGWLCKKCAKRHNCEEEYLLPVVNSPRVGVCGYGVPEGEIS